GSPFFKSLLEECIKNIENREYFIGYNGFLKITGPLMALEVFKTFVSEPITNINEFKVENYSYKIFHVASPEIYLNSQLIWSQNDNNVNVISKGFDKNYYSTMWSGGNIYTDDNSKYRLSLTGIFVNGFYLTCLISLGILVLLLYLMK